MVDFCSECETSEVYGIDLFKIAVELKPGKAKVFICKGCDNRALYKSEEGKLFIVKREEGNVKYYKVELEQLIKS